MLDHFASILADSAAYVLHTQFGATVDQTANTAPFDGRCVCGSITVAAESTFTLHMWMPSDTAQALAAKMLMAQESDLSEKDVQEATAELVNLIAGHAKTTLSNQSDCLFELGLPQIENHSNLRASGPGQSVQTEYGGIKLEVHHDQ